MQKCSELSLLETKVLEEKEGLSFQRSSWQKLSSFLWHAWCLSSFVGIWPQYIEPNLLFQRNFIFNEPELPSSLENLRIVHFSDLHINKESNPRFLKRLQKKINRNQPDFIFFTGDFLTASEWNSKTMQLLRDFFSLLSAKKGIFAVLGNHDYEFPVSLSEEGIYDVNEKNDSTPLMEGFKRLFHKKKILGQSSPKAKSLQPKKELLDLLETCHITVLHNETKVVDGLNIVGLGEHILGKVDPHSAFCGYEKKYPGIILTHNPDSWKNLLTEPGNLLLSGHSHRGQINLPWFRDRFVALENPLFRYGPFHFDSKVGLVTAGVGGMFRFRCFAPPEIISITLKKGLRKLRKG